MSCFLRPATLDDLGSLYELAKLTGGGFTNLPPDRKSLKAKLERSTAALARQEDEHVDDLFVMVLENRETGEVRGTCQIFTMVGQHWPFYSYRIGTLTQQSKELNRTFRADMLTLSTDLEGASEVGGLFLHPRERAGGLGMLLARSRYLFIKKHRGRFSDRTLAELRGVIDEAGGSPFWDGLAGKFFGMTFQEADEFNAVNGNQFIADLMPKHPIYIDMLPESARHVIAMPHPSGRAAMRMLEHEGFAHDKYIDIFDGGPTMVAYTDRIRSIQSAVESRVARIGDVIGERRLATAGRLATWRAAYAEIEVYEGGDIALDELGAKLLNVSVGDYVTHVGRT
ncbi:MAG: arginine N-succinyltransferase [Proteobacteria bacterium]|nr:arginine N-succinyltransferase [Pseudomonadota bacterium]